MRNIKIAIIGLTVFFAVSSVFGQSYQIGTSSDVLIDSSRGNRQISVSLYYPASTTGNDVPLATGTHPLLVFGHGFVMGVNSYSNFWSELVPYGYIMVLPESEGSFSPSHQDFADDLNFIIDFYMNESSANPASLFYNGIDEAVLMGHSMGAGSSALAAAAGTQASFLINFAMNDTDPSALAVAANISIPSLIFSGGNDCISSPDENQLPLFCSIGSTDKYFISIIGASHCQFADYNFNCSFGEMTCSPGPSISREEQHAAVFDMLRPYLDWKVNGNPSSGVEFMDSLNTSLRINWQSNCYPTGSNAIMDKEPEFNTWYEVENSLLHTHFDMEGGIHYQLVDSMGRVHLSGDTVDREFACDASGLVSGVYIFRVLHSGNQYSRKVYIN